jgi:LysR family transcriptional regulator, pca operon transcriptional activator
MVDQRIKFRHLQTFVEVARQKSVIRAAEILHVSQPAVTKTIRELEDILGVSLFDREGRGIRISRYGEVFLRHAGATMTALRQAVDSVSQEAARAGPPVRVGALPTVSVRIMPKAMAGFLTEKTGSPVKIVTGENAVLLEQLLSAVWPRRRKWRAFPSSIFIRKRCASWCAPGTRCCHPAFRCSITCMNIPC